MNDKQAMIAALRAAMTKANHEAQTPTDAATISIAELASVGFEIVRCRHKK